MMVVHSPTLGLMPCEIVGENESNYLIRLPGTPKPLTVPRASVFDLAEGVTLEGGHLVGDPVARDPGDVREIQTSGGAIALDGGQVVNAYCDRCHRSGLPSNRGSRWVCICGETIARADEVEQCQN